MSLDLDEPDEIVRWWRDAGPSRWFAKDDAFDRRFRERWLEAHLAAARREFDGWRDEAGGALALCLLLDQYPRNAFRGTPHMYATDPLARAVAAEACDRGFEQRIEPALRLFLFLPFAHSELLADQDRSVVLARQLGDDSIEHAEGHRDIVRRFGRFPHRNRILGRTTTAEEQAFLAGGGFAG